ncbi:MAG TPA: PsbP-related protein [Candidatus Paceibacterota bacterium]|nr:PsbP-related protein [Candidatus Paceibacterota bacterium]
MKNKGFVNILLVTALIVALTAAGFFIFDRSLQKEIEPNNELVVPDDVSTSADKLSNTISNLLTYTNTKYGYSLSYPNDWIIEPEQRIVDQYNEIVSLVNIHNPDKSLGVNISISRKEPGIKYVASSQSKLSINGSTETAYLFPKGYECGMADPAAKDCSFFIVAIQHNGFWYDLRAGGHAEAVAEPYTSIFSSFKFTGTGIKADEPDVVSSDSWRRYSNKRYNYSFKYPAGAIIETAPANKIPEACLSIKYKDAFIYISNPKDSTEAPCGPTGVGLGYTPDQRDIEIGGILYVAKGFEYSLQQLKVDLAKSGQSLSSNDKDETNQWFDISSVNGNMRVVYGVNSGTGVKLTDYELTDRSELISSVLGSLTF